MGGSSNTILPLLAAAQEADLEVTLEDIDAISRKTPCLSKVPPNGTYLFDHVHRAGGIPAILGELDRGGMLNQDVRSVHGPDLRSWLDIWDIRGGKASEEAIELFLAAYGCVRSATAFSQSERWDSLDTDDKNGCIRSIGNAHTVEGALAVLRGNISVDGCVVKTAGVDESLFRRTGSYVGRAGPASARFCGSPVFGPLRDPFLLVAVAVAGCLLSYVVDGSGF
jgi:dihydroxy-acid dehydratase